MHAYLLLLMWHQLLFSATFANRNYFTSTSHIAQLSKTKFRLAEALLEYADNETLRLDRVREFARNLQQQTQKDAEMEAADVERLEHPVEAFLTIRRMGHDWRRLLGNSNDAVDAVLKYVGLDELPTSDDFDGAADALLRLQDVYGISAESMARGRLSVRSQGLETDRSDPLLLSVEDCLHLIGRAFNHSMDLIGMEWVSLLSSSVYASSDGILALPAVLDILQSRFQKVQHSHDKIGQSLGSIWKYSKSNVTVLDQYASKALPKLEKDLKDDANYRRLCKDGSYNQSSGPTSRHVCRYTVPHPFFTLAPLKEELLNVNPRVVFLYDVLTDGESNRLIQVADPRLNRASVVGSRIPKNRISKIAFLQDDDDWSVRKVNQKLGFVTGLNVTDSDLLQMGNYGIGGQYEPHMDSFGFGVYRGNNNRMATVLLYLNSVKQGGGTVFPRLGLRALPVKNGALFWHNMRRNSSDIYDTTHAACPVLEGSKWVSNKWIYYLGQMHHRPCSLSQLD